MVNATVHFIVIKSVLVVGSNHNLMGIIMKKLRHLKHCYCIGIVATAFTNMAMTLKEETYMRALQIWSFECLYTLYICMCYNQLQLCSETVTIHWYHRMEMKMFLCRHLVIITTKEMFKSIPSSELLQENYLDVSLPCNMIHHFQMWS